MYCAEDVDEEYGEWGKTGKNNENSNTHVYCTYERGIMKMKITHTKLYIYLLASWCTALCRAQKGALFVAEIVVVVFKLKRNETNDT